jgi:hypothetical protein
LYTRLFLCPWEDKALDGNRKRTLNPWYQFLIHTIEKGILDEWGCEFVVLDPKRDRLAQVMSHLSP